MVSRKDQGRGEQSQWLPVPCGPDQCQALNLPPSPYLPPSTPFPSSLHSALVSLLPPNRSKLSLSPDFAQGMSPQGLIVIIRWFVIISPFYFTSK